MRQIRLLHIVAILLISFNILSGQKDYLAHIQRFSVNEGLSHRNVYAFHEDKRGFMWVGTQYGLNRFDGHDFKWFTKEKNGLSTNEINHIVEDAAGNFWLFHTQNWYYDRDAVNVTVFNPYEEVVVPIKFPLDKNHSFKDWCGYISTSSKSLYFGAEGYLIKYRPSSGFQHFKVDNINELKLEHYSTNHTLWAKSENNDLIELDTLGNILRKIPFINSDNIHIEDFHTDEKGNLYFIEYTDSEQVTYQTFSIYYLDTNNEFHKINIPISDDLLKTNDWSRQVFYQLSKDFFWFKSSPDLFVFDTKKGIIYDFGTHHNELAHSDIRKIHFDKEGRIWIGSFNGFSIINFHQNPFERHLYLNPEQNDPTAFYSCRGIWEEEGDLLLNTYFGAIELDGKNQTKLPYIPFQDNKSLLLYHPHAIYLDQKGNRWFGDFALIKQPPNSEKFQYWNFLDKPEAERIWAINEDKSGKIWVGTEEGGLYYLDTTVNLCVPFAPDKAFEVLQTSWVKAIVKDANDIFYVATNKGLYLLDTEKGVISWFGANDKANAPIPTDDIRHIHVDKEGVVWLATYGMGLLALELDAAQKRIVNMRQFTIADGLSNNNLYSVYEDNNQQLWISSDKGIIRFDKKTAKNRAYLPQDGTTHHEFNTISHFQGKDGKLYFGSLNGVTAFHPNQLTGGEESYDMPLIITNFQKFDKNAQALQDKTDELRTNPIIILAPGERFFDISVALLDYANANQLRYRWKIDGFHTNWETTLDNRFKVGGLPYGNYTLLIQGQGADGRFSTQQIKIPIEVLRPLHLRWWFIISIIGCLAFGIYTFLKWRTAQLLRRQSELEQQVQLRTSQIQEDKQLIENQNQQLEQQAATLRDLDAVKSRFFANVSHELRTPLTLMLAPIDSVLKSHQLDNRNYTFLSLAQQNGKKLLKLVSEILDLSKLESDKIQLETKPTLLYPLTKRLVASFESYAETQAIQFQFYYKAEKELNIQLDTHKYETILNNLLSNAFKFTPNGGQVKVQVEDLAHTIRLSIADTGRGIHPEDLPHIFDRFYQTQRPDAVAEGGTGIGLALCQEFAKLHKGKLLVKSSLTEGSTFIFEFPKEEVLGALSDEAYQEWQSLDKVEQNNLPVVPTVVQDEKETTTLLIVEDNPSLRIYLTTILSHYNIATAENGQKALEWLENNTKPALIISDVMMPIMDGFQLLERLKSSQFYQSIPMIMLTARAELKDKLKALRIGVDDYLTKPFVQEELLTRIENLLKNAEVRQSEKIHTPTETATENTEVIDKEWLNKLETAVLERLDKIDFSIDDIAEELQISRRQMHRRLKTYIGQTPNQYIKTLRLTKARTLLEEGAYPSVREVSFAVGFRDVKYFSAQFKKAFGRLPSEYL